jgi:NADH-quinone oxidoreductase subunit N
MLAQVPDRIVSPSVEWFALSPMLVLLGGTLVLLMASVLVPAMARRHVYSLITVALAGAAIVLSFINWNDVRDSGAKSLVSGAIGLDGFSIFMTIAICSALALAALLADDYLRSERMDGVEWYALMMLAAIGGIVMSSANDLIVLFLGVETLSISLYVLAGSHLRRAESQESALKYFVLGGFASAFLLYGIALTYGATGTTSMETIAAGLRTSVLASDHIPLLYGGMALMLVGLGFKVAAVPFHTWTPDVYQGAPTPVTGFMASAAKAAGFAALVRVFVVMLNLQQSDWRPIIYALAVLTLVVGSVMAVVQTDVKRMLAYSSISHAGFMLVGVQAASNDGIAAVLFYAMAYTFMVLGTFGVITVVSGQGDAATSLEDFRGLSKRRPVLALCFTVFLLAQAGVPLTSGFMAKFQIISAAVDAKSYGLAIVAMVASVVAAFLYLRIIVSMYLVDDDPTVETHDNPASAARPWVPWTAAAALTVAAAFTIAFGVWPSPLVDFARDAQAQLVAGVTLGPLAN